MICWVYTMAVLHHTFIHSIAVCWACANLCSCCSLRLASCTMLKLATNIKAMPSIYLCTHITESAVHECIGGNISAIFNLVDVKENQVANSAIISMYPMHAVTIVGVTMHWLPLISPDPITVLRNFVLFCMWYCVDYRLTTHSNITRSNCIMWMMTFLTRLHSNSCGR